MLLEFSVANFLSIREKVTLSMVKGPGAELEASNVIKCNAPSTPDLLASAVIYGANGAGKSNILQSLSTMRRIVCDSARLGTTAPSLPVTPFLLDDVSTLEPSEFNAVFIVDNVRYQYGFSATPQRIVEEWLYSYPKGRPRALIERNFQVEYGRYMWGNMNKLVGQKQVWQDATREDALFLSTATLLNCSQLRPIYDWFSSQLRIIGLRGWTGNFSAYQCEDEGSRQRIEHFLSVADAGIEGIELDRGVAYDWNDVIEFPRENPDPWNDLRTVHLTNTGRAVKFEFERESDGTQKLFSIAGPWLDALDNGYILIVDELNDNLHSRLVEFLVKLFHDSRVNVKGAQLVFTTHDTSLLNQNLFRRDQIWLCEKNNSSSSTIYSLVEFSPRKGVENLERGYLGGRYGALPIIGELAGQLGG